MSDAQNQFGDGDGGESGSASFGQVFNPREKKEPEVDWSKMGAGNTLGGAAAATPAQDMDDDLMSAIQASLSDVNLPEPQPEPAEGGYEVMIRFKTDEPQKRVFAVSATVKHIFEFVEFVNLKEQKYPSLSGSMLYSVVSTG